MAENKQRESNNARIFFFVYAKSAFLLVDLCLPPFPVAIGLANVTRGVYDHYELICPTRVMPAIVLLGGLFHPDSSSDGASAEEGSGEATKNFLVFNQ